MTHSEPERVTPELLAELYRIEPSDPEHLPLEIERVEAFRQRHPALPQVACFDTASYRTLPRVARLLPIPCRYEAQGLQRYGFHGLSYAYLIEELPRLGDPAARTGRLAHARLIRERICDGLAFLGIALDAERNAEKAALISRDSGRVRARVVDTDEEIMLAGPSRASSVSARSGKPGS